MYIPKFYPIKENYKIVKKYKSITISKLIVMYLRNGFSNRELDDVVLNLSTPGYESNSILSYFGLTINHRALFDNYDLKDIIRLLNESSYSIGELVEYLNIYVQHSDSPLSDDSLIKEEAYYNSLMRIRNRDIQQKLRIKLLEEFDTKCCICDIDIPDLLVAAHIIPYSQCNQQIEDISNPNNALLLCVMHDKLFESSNYISFNENRLFVSSKLSLDKLADYKLKIDFVLSEKYLNTCRKKFLSRHYKLFLDKQNL